jgi:4-hydroxyphenylpyruvate dioxygenase
MGTDGFEFVEYTAPDSRALATLFESLGFSAVARHRSKNVLLYRQGEINFIINHEPDSFAQSFARVHGPSVCALGMRVKDAAYAYKRALDLGAKPHMANVGPMELNIPAIQGIGGSLIYLIDRYGPQSIYDVDFTPLPGAFPAPKGVGLKYIDHLTHNVQAGRMDVWASSTASCSTSAMRYFDIKGQRPGLLAVPDQSMRQEIASQSTSSDNKSQPEYLNAYHGEGIRISPLLTEDIFTTVEALREKGVAFMEHTRRLLPTDRPALYRDTVRSRALASKMASLVMVNRSTRW